MTGFRSAQLPAGLRQAGVPVADERLTASRDPLRILLFLVTVVIVSRIQQHFSFIEPFRPVLLLALAAILCVIVRPRSIDVSNLLEKWPAKLVAALGLAACISVPFGIYLGGSARYILDTYSRILIYTLLLMAATRNPRDLYLFIWAYVIACGILSWMSLFVFQLVQVSGNQSLRLVEMYMYDSNDAGLVLIVGLPLTALAFKVSRLPGKVVSAVILMGIGASLARGGSRGAFVGLVVVGVAMFFTFAHIPLFKRVGLLGLLVATLAFAAPSGYWRQMGTILRVTEDYNWVTLDGRKATTLRGLGYMLDHPVFGIGIDNFGKAEGTISRKARDVPAGVGVKWMAPHNSFVQVGAELGIPGLVLWSALAFGVIVGASRLRRRLPRSWLGGDPEQRFLYLTSHCLPLSMVGFVTTAVFLSFAYESPLYILAAYMVGLYASVECKCWTRSVPGPSRSPGRWRSTLAAYHRF